MLSSFLWDLKYHSLLVFMRYPWIAFFMSSRNKVARDRFLIHFGNKVVGGLLLSRESEGLMSVIRSSVY